MYPHRAAEAYRCRDIPWNKKSRLDTVGMRQRDLNPYCFELQHRPDVAAVRVRAVRRANRPAEIRSYG